MRRLTARERETLAWANGLRSDSLRSEDMAMDYLEDDRDMDPGNWDRCDEHETVFRKGASCPGCDEEIDRGSLFRADPEDGR